MLERPLIILYKFIKIIGVIGTIFFGVHAIKLASIRERPLFSVAPQIAVLHKELLFVFKNVGSLQAENVRVRTFSIFARPEAEDNNYDQFVLENLNKFSKGTYLGIIPPNVESNVSWSLKLNNDGKIQIYMREIFVLQISFNIGQKKKSVFAFYRPTILQDGGYSITLVRQIEENL